MTPEKFAELTGQNFNRIPVTREVLADFDSYLCNNKHLISQLSVY